MRFFWGTDIHGKPQVYGVHTGEGTPYENVRVANMQWNEQTQRYEFTPLTMSMAPDYLDAGKSGTWECSGHTGNDRPPLEQPTILVTPIPDGTDTYTTPPFPVPDPKEFNDYILVFPADPVLSLSMFT